MQFENEPEGWDDHMIAEPPDAPRPPRTATDALGAFWRVMAFYAVIAIIGIGTVIALVWIWA